MAHRPMPQGASAHPLAARLHSRLPALPRRIGEVITAWVEQAPDRPALIGGDGQWSYRELAIAIASARDWLAQRGVRAGDRVVLACENCRTAVALLLAASALEAWPVPLTARLSPPEVDAIRVHSGARVVLHALGSRAALETQARGHGAALVEVPGAGLAGLGPFDPRAEVEPAEPDPAQQVAVVIYTSGSTGRPKGVMLTHRNLLYIAAYSGIVRSVTPADQLGCLLPISHSIGLSALLLSGLLHGASLRLFARFNPPELLGALQREPISILLGTPGLFSLLVDYAAFKDTTTITSPALRIISCSGAPLDLALKQASERLFGLPLDHAYGLTETSPTIAQTLPGSPRSDLSVGPVVPGISTRLLDAAGREVGGGDVGELWVRGPTVMRGYYRAPAETAAALDADGWFNTGDLARLQDGQLFIVGRTKDLIIRFGFNVYPTEIEAVLNEHPAVVQSAVIGRQVGSEQEIVAFVQPVPGSDPSAAALARHAAGRLASYKQPSEIVFIDSMPTTPSGKILKHQLPLGPAHATAGERVTETSL